MLVCHLFYCLLYWSNLATRFLCTKSHRNLGGPNGECHADIGSVIPQLAKSLKNAEAAYVGNVKDAAVLYTLIPKNEVRPEKEVQKQM